jgi:putative membrane protein
MDMRTFAILGATALAVFTSSASAQAPGSAQTRNYIAAAGQSDTFEMLEADTALTQSKDPQVRAFAEQMLRDHAQLSQALSQAAASAGVMPPPTIVGADQAPLLAGLQSLSGADFDRAYWQHQALAHRSALTVTQHYAANGDSAPVRRAASAAIPIITAHLSMAEQMQAQFQGS